MIDTPAYLLHTKLQRPQVTDNLVVRPRLLAQLDRTLACPLTLICAGAGFGKTTLVSSWVAGIAGDPNTSPAAWLSLDSKDSDLVMFVRYLTAALRTIFPIACAETTRLISVPQQPPAELLATALSNDIAQLPGPFVLVLDDYHTLHGCQAIHDLLNELLRHWPQPLHLVMITRHNPPLPLAGLRAKGLVNEIRNRDLRFTHEETGEYLARALPASAGEPVLALLEQRAEGWIAGLQLAVLSLSAAGDAESTMANLSVADAFLADYLVDEVLAAQPPAIQAFLLATSNLDHFCASLCESVLGTGDPAWPTAYCLAWLERANLFVIALDTRKAWYRYHHLFRDVLQQRLLATRGTEYIADLHRKASTWFAQQGMIDEAIRHALKANDLDHVATLMEYGLRELLNNDDRPTLERWLSYLPEEFIQRRPGLLLLKAWVLQFSWQLAQQRKVLEQIETLIRDERTALTYAPGEQTLRAQLAGLHAQTAYYNNELDHAVAYSQEALALAPPSWTYLRGGAMIYLGFAMQARGQGDEAKQLLLDAYGALDNKAGAYALRLLFTLGFIYLQEGALEDCRLTALTLLEKANHSSLAILQSWAHFFLGTVSYHRNELAAAATHFTEIAANPYTAQSVTVRDALTGLALIRQIDGDSHQAWQHADSLSRRDLEQFGSVQDSTRSLRAKLMFLQGRRAEATAWAAAFTASPSTQLNLWLEDPHTTQAYILLGHNHGVVSSSVLPLLASLNAHAERTHNVRHRIELLALTACAHYAGGEMNAAQTALLHALTLARTGGFVRLFLNLGPRMYDLLSLLSQNPTQAALAHNVLAAFSTPEPPCPPHGADAHPAPPIHSSSSPLTEPLTRRELEILMLLRQPMSAKDIAHKLGISHLTVKRHTINIYAKLNVASRWDAVSRATELGIFSPA